jgi:CheY-like chemotaxis protein
LEPQGTGFQPIERGFHVLVVDDDQDAAERFCALLRIWGYQSEACCDATTVLQAAWEHHPDCLIIDIDMPGLVGHTLAREVREQPGFDCVILIALSLYSDEAHVRCSREAGFHFHFVKPMGRVPIRRLKYQMETVKELVQLGGETEEQALQNAALH